MSNDAFETILSKIFTDSACEVSHHNKKIVVRHTPTSERLARTEYNVTMWAEQFFDTPAIDVSCERKGFHLYPRMTAGKSLFPAVGPNLCLVLIDAGNELTDNFRTYGNSPLDIDREFFFKSLARRTEKGEIKIPSKHIPKAVHSLLDSMRTSIASIETASYVFEAQLNLLDKLLVHYVAHEHHYAVTLHPDCYTMFNQLLPVAIKGRFAPRGQINRVAFNMLQITEGTPNPELFDNCVGALKTSVQQHNKRHEPITDVGAVQRKLLHLCARAKGDTQLITSEHISLLTECIMFRSIELKQHCGRHFHPQEPSYVTLGQEQHINAIRQIAAIEFKRCTEAACQGDTTGTVMSVFQPNNIQRLGAAYPRLSLPTKMREGLAQDLINISYLVAGSPKRLLPEPEARVVRATPQP